MAFPQLPERLLYPQELIHLIPANFFCKDLDNRYLYMNKGNYLCFSNR